MAVLMSTDKQTAGRTDVATITIAGLGPGRRGLRTVETDEAITAATQIVLRTAIHPDVDDLVGDSRVVVCDDIYESADLFEPCTYASLNASWSLRTWATCCISFQGHPRYGEFVTERIEELA
ncbi:MAG: hypothetical protein R2843_07315 [Thermomicrobiales bacterium]